MTDPIIESDNADFRVTLDPISSSNTTVTVEVTSATDGFGVNTDDKTVTVPANQGSAVLSMSTTDNSLQQEDGSIAVRIHPNPSGYVKGDPNRASVTM